MTVKNVLNFEAQIVEGKIIYVRDDVEARLKEFKELHEHQFINVIFEAHTATAYFQHKYFHGYVLPQICEAMGEKDQDYVKEFVLKEQKLFRAVESFRQIPVKHRKKLRTISEPYPDHVTGEIKHRLVGYVPSTTVIDFSEMRDFILWCEDIRDGMIDWSILKDQKDKYEDMMKLRELAMSEGLDRLTTGGEEDD